jgi:uncharacterized protein (DUF2062 family)
MAALTKKTSSPGRSGRRAARSPRWWRRVLRWLLMLRGSPAAIARGAAIGVFLAFTPLLGVQMICAVLLATFCNANRIIAAAAVWITNPVTIPPIYALCYWVGSRVWPGPPAAHVRQVLGRTVAGLAHLDAWEVYDQFLAFIGIGRDILIPLTIGGVVVGTAAAIPAYFVVLVAVQRVRRLHWPHLRRGRRAPGQQARGSQPPD